MSMHLLKNMHAAILYCRDYNISKHAVQNQYSPSMDHITLKCYIRINYLLYRQDASSCTHKKKLTSCNMHAYIIIAM